MNTRIKFLAAALVLLSALPAFAAQDPDQKTLEAVVVTASRSETRLDEMPLHTTLITHDDIQKSPAQTLDQLLRNIPGMNLTGAPAAVSDPTGHQAKMRGLGNAKVLVLLDGVPIHDPFYLTVQWFKVPLSNIDRVEVIRGGNSSLWGNMAMAGVINIVSRRAADNSGEVVASIGTQGTRNLAVSKNLVISDLLAFNLAADIFHTDGYQTTPDEYLWRFPGKRPVVAENKNLQLSAFLKPSADLEAFLRIGYHIQDQDISYQFGNNLQKSPDFAAGLKQNLSDKSSLQVKAWAQYVEFEKFNGNACYYQGAANCLVSTSTALTPTTVNNNIVQFYTQYGSQSYREQGGSLVYSKNLEGRWNSVQVGADYRHLSASDTELFYTTPSSPAAAQANFNSSTAGRGDQTFQGLFGQTKIYPTDPLELTLSGRYNIWRIGNRNNSRTTAAGIGSGGNLPDATKSAFNPSLAARYELNQQLYLRGAAYKAFRAPGFNNLTRTFGTGTSTTIANPDLAPESLTGWELGGDFKHGGLGFSATYFLYNIKDMIATYTASSAGAPQQVQTICGGPALPGCSGSAKYYTNDQDGQSHGVELTGNWKLRDNLTLEASFTHTETYLTRRGAIVTDPLGVQLVATPKNVASLGLTWKAADRLRGYAELRYIGPMLLDTTSNNGSSRFAQGGNTVVNASANYAWDNNVDLFAGVTNLFDRAYSENGYASNQPYNSVLSMPRALNAGLKIRF